MAEKEPEEDTFGSEIKKETDDIDDEDIRLIIKETQDIIENEDALDEFLESPEGIEDETDPIQKSEDQPSQKIEVNQEAEKEAIQEPEGVKQKRHTMIIVDNKTIRPGRESIESKEPTSNTTTEMPEVFSPDAEIQQPTEVLQISSSDKETYQPRKVSILVSPTLDVDRSLSTVQEVLEVEEESIIENESEYIVNEVIRSIINDIVMESVEDITLAEITSEEYIVGLVNEIIDKSLGIYETEDMFWEESLSQFKVAERIGGAVDLSGLEDMGHETREFLRGLSLGVEEESPVPPTQGDYDPQVLAPDNPLMIRFQNALRTHLQKQKTRFEEEILNLQCEIKEENKLEDSISHQIYNIELNINQQVNYLDKLKSDVQEINLNFDNILNIINQAKTELSERLVCLNDLKKKDGELHIEKESLAALIQQFTEWEANQSSDISVTKIMSERQKTEKRKLFNQKQKLDIIILAMRKEILKMSTSYEQLLDCIKVKLKEKNDLQQAFADASSDIDTLMLHNKRLLVLWHRNTILIKERDKAMHEVKQHVAKHRSCYITLEIEMEKLSRETDNLIKENEQLTNKYVLVEKYFNIQRKKLKEELDKKDMIQAKLAQIVQMKDVTESDLNRSQQDLASVQRKTNECVSVWDQLKATNEKLEEDIIIALQHQASETATTGFFNTRIGKLRTELREKEVLMADLENKIAKIMVGCEREQSSYKCGEIALTDAKNEVSSKEHEIARVKTELNRTMSAVSHAQKQVDIQACKLDRLRETRGEAELTPEGITIRELESKITNLEEQIEQQQLFWIRQESYIVTLSNQRMQQLHKISVTRKQLLIIDNKLLKIEHEISNVEKESNKYLGSKALLQKKLIKLNEKRYKTKGLQEMLDNINFVKQTEYMGALKDAEDKSVALHNEIHDIETDKEEAYVKINELQKEILSWERKWQMAVETRQLIENFHSNSGDLGSMKQEIHRMEVRYTHLCNAQEKLAQDMEMCVSRRDGIVNVALARERRNLKSVHYTKQQAMKKIEDMKNNIKKVNANLKVIEKERISREERTDELSKQLKLKNEQLLGLKSATEQMDFQLAEGHLHRQKNLELIVRLQRKAHLYNLFKGQRYKLLFRNESSLELEHQQQKETNSHIESIVEALIVDFPSLQMNLNGILNSLRLTTC